VGDSSGSIGPMEVTSRAVLWGSGVTCGMWRCRRDSGVTLRGWHQCARKGARVSGTGGARGFNLHAVLGQTYNLKMKAYTMLVGGL